MFKSALTLRLLTLLIFLPHLDCVELSRAIFNLSNFFWQAFRVYAHGVTPSSEARRKVNGVPQFEL